MDLLEALERRREKALSVVHDELSKNENFTKLDGEYPKYPGCVALWQTSLYARGRSWSIHLVYGNKFPNEAPRIYILDAPELFLQYPHIDKSGYVCTVGNDASINNHDPIGVLYYTINAARKILEGVDGDDFREEFLSYWGRVGNEKRTVCYLLTPPGELDDIFFVSYGESICCIATKKRIIETWCQNRFDKEIELKILHNGICFDLQAPLLPTSYPRTLLDLVELPDLVASKNHNILLERIAFTNEDCIVCLRQATPEGFSLAAVRLSGLSLASYSSLSHGFRKGNVPANILIKRASEILRGNALILCDVHRLDHEWIHSRGGDGVNYKNYKVIVIGCGSLGGYVVHLLSRAGVGNLILLDNDTLEYSNLGRHILGAESTESSKAVALSAEITKQMPHLDVVGFKKDWRDALAENSDFFEGADAIVTTVADWECEEPLNYLSRISNLPPIIHGWLEPYAVAGHSLLSIKGSGCLACRMNYFGQFHFAVSHFVGQTLKREPGGCTHYQQYGPTALLPVASMIATSVLDCLRDKPDCSVLKTWISSAEHFQKVGAEISNVWKENISSQGYSRMYITTWPKSNSCDICNA